MRIDWSEIYDKNASKMLGICRRYLGDPASAEDAMHDAFLKAIDRVDTYRGTGAIEAWLRKIVVNTALQHVQIKKKVREMEKNKTAVYDRPLVDAHSTTSTSLVALAEFGQRELLDTIDQLPDHHRSVFNLYVLDQYKHHEIAEMLDISPGTSKSHLARARKKLQKLLMAKADDKNCSRAKKLALLALLPNHIDTHYQSIFSRFEIVPIGAPTFPFSKRNLGSAGHKVGFQSVLIKWLVPSLVAGVIGVGYMLIVYKKEPPSLQLATRSVLVPAVVLEEDEETPSEMALSIAELRPQDKSNPEQEGSALVTRKRDQPLVATSPVVVVKKTVIVRTIFQYEDNE